MTKYTDKKLIQMTEDLTMEQLCAMLILKCQQEHGRTDNLLGCLSISTDTGEQATLVIAVSEGPASLVDNWFRAVAGVKEIVDDLKEEYAPVPAPSPTHVPKHRHRHVKHPKGIN